MPLWHVCLYFALLLHHAQTIKHSSLAQQSSLMIMMTWTFSFCLATDRNFEERFFWAKLSSLIMPRYAGSYDWEVHSNIIDTMLTMNTTAMSTMLMRRDPLTSRALWRLGLPLEWSSQTVCWRWNKNWFLIPVLSCWCQVLTSSDSATAQSAGLFNSLQEKLFVGDASLANDHVYNWISGFSAVALFFHAFYTPFGMTAITKFTGRRRRRSEMNAKTEIELG